MDNIIYFDNFATTSLNEEVFDSMKNFLIYNYSNPSSLYEFSQKSRVAIEKSRENISNYINADKNELFFTSGGTEADNWAFIGMTLFKGRKNGHIILTAFEHSAILETAKFLKNRGFDVTYIFPDRDGFIDAKDVTDAIREDTFLVSVMYVNNEVGTIQDIKKICSFVKKKNPNIVFHTDAVQALSEIKIDVKDLNVDLLSVSGHKVHAPKGIGALYIKSGTEIENFIFGGSQERSRRAGTENVAGIVGFSKAIDILRDSREKNVSKRFALREYFLKILNENFSRFNINGSLENRYSGNINISFPEVDKEMLIMSMDFRGICISGGSACSSGAVEKSHVLDAMGIEEELKNSAVRISFGENNTFEEIDEFILALKEIID
ncbi:MULTISPECIES: cysteine desulfurase family protein [Parvimonas]|uniref:cysteine desulfurase n=3 Tax=Bacillota TaxID=1239 RepID=A0A0B4S1H3_9FIRM|nr:MULTISPECIES: cysteine desulfurase family protein [Parvimonas]AIZ36384.1 cysteine desulfurase [Parvimonas micra]AXU10269.1 cysteine desulfurase [Parvimonas micra]MEB3057916.1 cysteine desulfurase family protein [Parvimonas sp. D9]RSB91171.1 cysteine desulfurase [Parvimonas micra]WBB28897.1 cysteine desulfurase [Parvimonas micra]